MPDLREFLEQTFEAAGGELPFEKFMELALYDPDFGYYTTNIRDVGGGRGDFATSATLTDGLAGAVASWIREEMAFHDGKQPVPVIEVGAGNGKLAAGILQNLGWSGRRKIGYHIVDISPPLQERQRETLGRRGSRITWHESILSALEKTGGHALIFSNELVDAFPAKWLRWNGGPERWEEIFVRFDSAAGLSEVFRPLENIPVPEIKDPKDGQRIEVQPGFRKWLGELSKAWTAGSMLTIDYGGSAEEIYHRRPQGTLRAYYRNQRQEGGTIYQRFGKQDLTLDVNFDDLQKWGEELGWESVALDTQAAFLSRYGSRDDLMARSEAGKAFQVLHQRKL